MAKILIESGPLRGQSLILSPGRPLAIGRDARCAVRCQDALVSRVHAVLRPKGDQWLLQDRDSANGTFINEAPIQTAKLSGGDVIRVGDTLLSFVVEDDDPLLKREVAGYRLERRLGRGASGTVYLALQISLDRTVAVKILAPRLARNPELVGRFLEEARAVARLNHPHVVQIHDAGQVDDLFFMSMEYLSGGTLEETLSREKQLPPHRVIEVGVDAAKALVFAEQNHIVHRDIKPANLLLSAKGAVKLGDLGIAIDVRRTPGGKGSGLAGSPRYMAPEQASDGAVDHRADIYALGATLYRALSGVAPFEGSTIQEILRAKLERDPVPLRRLLPNLSLSLSNVIQKMLARQPEMRFSSAAEVEDALERCSRMKTAARRPAAEASPRRPVPSRPLAPPPKTRTPPWVFAAAAVALLVVGLVAAKVMFPGSAQERPPRDASGGAGSPPRVASAPPDAGGASPSRAASSAFSLQVARETLDRIEAEYREGRIGAEEAEERLVKLLEGPGADSGIAQRVEALLAEIEKDAQAKMDAAVADLSGRIEGFLREGRFREAMALLSQTDAQGSIGERALAALRERIAGEIDRYMAAFEERWKPLLGDGKLDEAARDLEALVASMPDPLPARVERLRDELSAARQDAADIGTRLASAADAAWKATSSLDLEEAEQTVEALRRAGKLPAAAEALLSDVKLARAAWEGIVAALEARRKEQASLDLTEEKQGKRSARKVWVSELTGTAVRLRAGRALRGDHETRAVLSLDDAFLLEAVSAGGSQPEDAARRGLGLLLLVRRGEERARPVLAAAGLEDAPKTLPPAASTLWRQGRLVTARRQHAAFREAKEQAPVAADQWAFLADEARDLLLAWRSAAAAAEVIDELREIYRAARIECLLGTPPTGLFHARAVELKEEKTRGGEPAEAGTIVSLLYDFSTEEQLRDFHAVGGEGGALRWVKAKKVLELSGEARLLEGDPFRGRIAVDALLVPKGYEADAPNINLALWTKDRDAVMPRLDLSPDAWRRARERDDSPSDAADYIALGIGYMLEVDFDGLGEGIGRLARGFRNFLPSYVREPVYIIFAGRHGRRLHEDLRGEVIWDMPLGNALAATVRYQVLIDGAALRWAVNGKSLPFDGSAGLKRLESESPRAGSISFFTNGKTLFYSKIAVEGRLNPDWIRSRLAAQVEEELKALVPAAAERGTDGPEDGADPDP